MAYLEPPPFPAPVIVEKDVGGVVADYQARTEQYRREGREVRLHECRSACTLALSLPNVCVYPSSVLKFHKAYDWNTKIRDEAVSAELMSSYPLAVQARLGELTRDYRVLSGAELIALGVRDCRMGETRIARARPAPAAPPAAAESGDLFGTILAAITPKSPTPPTAVAARATAVAEPAAPDPSLVPAPLPPRRPSDLDVAPESVEVAETPLPPRRPRVLTATLGLPELIAGAQPTLPYGVLSYSAFGR